MKAKVYLEGEELKAYHLAALEASELAAKQLLILERSRRMMNASADSSDSDSEPEVEEEEEEVVEVAGIMRRRVGGFTGGAGAWDEFLLEEGAAPSTTTRKGQTFDIYVKQSYAPRLLSESRSSTLQRYRTFPVVERKRRVDAYGEAIDVDGWLRRGLEDESEKRDVRIGAGAAIAPVIGKRTREEEEDDEVRSSYLRFLSRD